MEYNPEFKILFEKSILPQLFSAYKYEFKRVELIDEVYANVRTYDPSKDRVAFTYSSKSDYFSLVKFVCRKMGVSVDD